MSILRCTALETPAEIQRLQKIIDGLAQRIAAQSELLARNAERRTESA